MTRTDSMLHGTIQPRPRLAAANACFAGQRYRKADWRIAPGIDACRLYGADDVASVGALLHAVQSQQPDVVVIDVDSPSRDTLEQLSMLHAHAPRPVVMFSGDGDDALIHAAVGAGVTAYVVDGLAPARLAPIVQVALARFAQESSMRKRLDDVQQALQDRKQIDRAKGLLMEKRGLSEADAYAALRQQAMKQGVKLAEVARRIVAMAELLG